MRTVCASVLVLAIVAASTSKRPAGGHSRLLCPTLCPPTHPPPARVGQVILDTLELSSRIKKTPVVVGNCTGFAVNRVFFPYTMAACMLVRGSGVADLQLTDPFLGNYS